VALTDKKLMLTATMDNNNINNNTNPGVAEGDYLLETVVPGTPVWRPMEPVLTAVAAPPDSYDFPPLTHFSYVSTTNKCVGVFTKKFAEELILELPPLRQPASHWRLVADLWNGSSTVSHRLYVPCEPSHPRSCPYHWIDTGVSYCDRCAKIYEPNCTIEYADDGGPCFLHVTHDCVVNAAMASDNTLSEILSALSSDGVHLDILDMVGYLYQIFTSKTILDACVALYLASRRYGVVSTLRATIQDLTGSQVDVEHLEDGCFACSDVPTGGGDDLYDGVGGRLARLYPYLRNQAAIAAIISMVDASLLPFVPKPIGIVIEALSDKAPGLTGQLIGSLKFLTTLREYAPYLMSGKIIDLQSVVDPVGKLALQVQTIHERVIREGKPELMDRQIVETLKSQCTKLMCDPKHKEKYTLLAREQNVIVELQAMFNLSGDMRLTPTGIFINGPPAIGKGTLVHSISVEIARLEGIRSGVPINVDNHRVYGVQAGEKYMEQLTPTMPIVWNDADAFSNPKISEEILAQTLACVSSDPWKPVKANVDAKKSSDWRGTHVFMTSNRTDPNAQGTFANDAAVGRRFPIFLRGKVIDVTRSGTHDDYVRWDVGVWRYACGTWMLEHEDLTNGEVRAYALREHFKFQAREAASRDALAPPKEGFCCPICNVRVDSCICDALVPKRTTKSISMVSRLQNATAGHKPPPPAPVRKLTQHERDVEKSACFVCHKVGHWASDCTHDSDDVNSCLAGDAIDRYVLLFPAILVVGFVLFLVLHSWATGYVVRRVSATASARATYLYAFYSTWLENVAGSIRRAWSGSALPLELFIAAITTPRFVAISSGALAAIVVLKLYSARQRPVVATLRPVFVGIDYALSEDIPPMTAVERRVVRIDFIVGATIASSACGFPLAPRTMATVDHAVPSDPHTLHLWKLDHEKRLVKSTHLSVSPMMEARTEDDLYAFIDATLDDPMCGHVPSAAWDAYSGEGWVTYISNAMPEKMVLQRDRVMFEPCREVVPYRRKSDGKSWVATRTYRTPTSYAHGISAGLLSCLEPVTRRVLHIGFLVCGNPDKPTYFRPLGRDTRSWPSSTIPLSGGAEAADGVNVWAAYCGCAVLGRPHPMSPEARWPERMAHMNPVASVSLNVPHKPRAYKVLSPLAEFAYGLWGYATDQFAESHTMVGHLPNVPHSVDYFYHHVAEIAPRDAPAIGKVPWVQIVAGLVARMCDPPCLLYKSPLPLSVAVAGVPGDSVLTPLDFSTSATPYPGHKRDYATDPAIYPRIVTPIVIERVREIISHAMAGRAHFLVAELNPKPKEVISRAKVEADAARVIYAFPLPFLIALRVYLLPVLAYTRMNNHVFRTLIGKNAAGKDWDALYREFAAVSDCAVDGDQLKFDKLMQPTIKASIVEIVLSASRRLGYTRSDVATLKVLLVAALTPHVLHRGSIYRTFHGLLSGVAGTADFQSWASLLLILGCCSLAGGLPMVDRFLDEAAYAFLGDDNAWAVKQDMADILTPAFVTDAMASFGYVYTHALDKNLPAARRPLAEITLLKRYFRYDSEVGRYLGARDKKSLAKEMAMVGKNSRGLPDTAVVSEIAHDLVRESWLWGRDKFGETVLALSHFAGSTPYPSYEECLVRYEAGTFETWAAT